ncbi:hypothetical protein NLX86_31235 [Streptomyces sp. A3M-1-3]|uniref:hypothetical protein n=1 Tax=Streptomyces sp. A3M-1-3 TaxID=2962044 RepID=UPI0020B6A2C0|nr:hypothetical protein [Streptomyces sp. A3M-1-3]MCP3822400.1 hypothetical protein [Streptomyces sp. A3M-1-3]
MPPPTVRRPAHPTVTLLALSGLLAGLTGCAGDGGGGGGAGDDARREPAVASTPTLLRTQGLTFPLDAYERTDADRDLLSRSQQLLAGRCMARYGFTYSPPPMPATDRGQDGSRRYGVSDPAAAATYGYASPGSARGAARPPQQAALSATGRLVLHGPDDLAPDKLPKSRREAETTKSGIKVNGTAIPVGGCLRESFLKLYAPAPDSVDTLFVFSLVAEAESHAREDSRVRRVFNQWSQCMKESGYSAASPLGAAEKLGFQNQELSSPAAVTAAKTDVACKEKVNLVGVAFAVESAYQRGLIEKNAETLKLAKAQHEERLRLASTLAAARR